MMELLAISRDGERFAWTNGADVFVAQRSAFHPVPPDCYPVGRWESTLVHWRRWFDEVHAEHWEPFELPQGWTWADVDRLRPEGRPIKVLPLSVVNTGEAAPFVCWGVPVAQGVA